MPAKKTNWLGLAWLGLFLTAGLFLGLLGPALQRNPSQPVTKNIEDIVAGHLVLEGFHTYSSAPVRTCSKTWSI